MCTREPTSTRATELIARLRSSGRQSFALLRRWNPETREPGPVEVLIGQISAVEHLADIPLPAGIPGAGPAHDALALVPFRQIRERGFGCHDDGTPLRVLRVEESHVLDMHEAIAALPEHEVTVRGDGFDIDDETYEAIVKRIVHDEIATGEGANFVIRRDFTAQLQDYGTDTALTLFRRLLIAERGAYWTFLVHAAADEHGLGGRTLVGASPEVHVRLDQGEAVMNPISGTYRYPESGRDTEGLLRFLDDAKETAELSMVLDEELKMMSVVGDRGGQVHGPYLREMAHLAHTEFEIRGQTSLDSRDVLRETLFAATVTGSPLENACRVIQRYEQSGRGYYAGALALFSRDSSGQQQLDSPILIRATDITPDGRLSVRVGATLVRDSDPRAEVAETWAKAAGVLTALGVVKSRHTSGTTQPGASVAHDPRITRRLEARRDCLAPFWLQPRETLPSPKAQALIIDTGDSFTAMLAHVLRSLGVSPLVRRYDGEALDELINATPGLVVLGPGPGDPTDTSEPRMIRLRALAHRLVQRAGEEGRPAFGVCLGHQLISQALGLRLVRKPVPYQGLQEEIDFFGRRSIVGFYNSFTAHAGDTAHHRGIELSQHASTGEVFALRMPNVVGVQFHPESVLTLDGQSTVDEIVRWLLPELFGK